MSSLLIVGRDEQPIRSKKLSRPGQYDEHVELWTLRLLTSFSSKLYDPWAEDRKLWMSIARVSARLAGSEDELVRSSLLRRLHKIESKGLVQEGTIFTNIAYLASVLSLSETEQKILSFTAIATRNHNLRAALRSMEIGTREFAIRVLSSALALPEAEVRKSCQRQSVLSEIGLLFRPQHDYMPMETLLNLDDAVAQHFFEEHESCEAFISWFFSPVAGGHLHASDFPHLARDFRIITAYLRHVIQSGTHGANILLYGPPGTGKTQFASVIAEAAGATLYEVGQGSEEEDADEDSGDRLVSYRICQRVLAYSQKGMVLFDEMEDAFPHEESFLGGKRQRYRGNKAPVTKLLEQNPVPTIWISNDAAYIDPAYLRRFDYVLEMPPPPRSVRRRILEQHFSPLRLPGSFLDRLAQNEDLSPAQAERVAKVIGHSEINQLDDLCVSIDRMVENSLRVHGHARGIRHQPEDTDFSTEYLNINTDISALVGGLRGKAASCRICFYGPPGTGKTSLARYIANETDRPLLVRGASDLLGSYVGETERNIARMFSAARDEDAVLLLDEADSFLRDRREAQRTWEVTQVNELLTQMEQFNGVFICSTNLMDHLDAASLRRFDFKIRFDYLIPEIRWKLFQHQINGWGYFSCLKDEEATIKRTLEKLDNLTPSDFAVANRRLRILGSNPLPSLLLASLVEECAAKQPASTGKIGFV